MKYINIILAVLVVAVAVTPAFSQSPQIINVLLDDGTHMDGAVLHYGVQRTVTVFANSDTTDVQFSCIDQLPVCKDDKAVPFTRTWTPNSVGMHTETFYPFHNPGLIQGPTVTAHFTVTNP